MELEKKFKLTLEDIRYLVEQDKISVAFFSTSTKFIFGFQKRRFHGCGICKYEGLFGLYRDDALKLFQSGKVSVGKGVLLEPEKADILSTDYPFKTQLPNGLIHSWNPASFKGSTVKIVDVIKYPFESKSIASVFNDAIKHLKTGALENAEKSVTTFTGYDDYQLSHNSTTYKLEDTCVPTFELYRAGFINESPIARSVGQEEYPVGKRTNELHELLFKILQQTDKKLSAKQCEKILVSESELHIDERLYDTGGILRAVSDSELAWESSRGNYQTIQLSSLGTTLSKLRKRFK